MPDPRIDRLRALFNRAIALPATERGALLRRECADDTALERRLVAMLAAAEGERFLNEPTAAPVPAKESGASPALHEGAGTQLGPYKLLQLIGEGGFGAVFLAEQEKPVSRRVALKIIKLGMDTRQVVARFEQERQALALMDHPNIARVIDAGATETGRPYFVMELVKGEPIADYCDKHKLSIAERLDLFAQVCNAVQHAHSKGIIHRDLKPSNILVATQDDRPLAKIIDFGIAKATSAKLTDKTLFTEHRQVIGTLQYMSPEQAEGSLDIDTRTDVYALGVVLYELLTGSTPFDAKTIREAFYSEVQRMIREVEPPKPSTRLSQSTDTLADVAASRRIAPGRLGMLVRGDLDWIVMKALEKDRTRRYQSVGGLGEDLQRYLAGEPVLAAPPSASYLVRKFVRRHRFGVGAAALVSAALLAGLGGTSWGMLEAKRGRADAELQTRRADAERSEAQRQREQVAKQRDETEKAREQLERVADFQARMLRRVPAFEMGRDLAADLSARVRDAQAELDLADEQRARALAGFNGLLGGISMTDAARRIIDANVLTPSAEAIAAEFGAEPLTQASLYHTLAKTYLELGIFDKARLQAQREFELRLGQQGPEHRDTLRSKALVCDLSWQLGEIDNSSRMLAELLPQLERVFGPEDPETLRTRGFWGVLLIEQSRNEEARTFFIELLAIQERTLGPEHEDVALTLANLGVTLLNLSRDEEAVPLFERALAIRRGKLGAEDAQTLSSQQALAKAYEGVRRFDDAYRLRLDSIETLARLKGANHPATITAIAQLATLYKKQNRFDEALVQASRALALRRVALGDAHPQTIESIGEVAMLLSTLGRHEQAEPMFIETLERSTEVYGADSAKTMGRVNNLAVSYWYQGKYAQVEPLFARALEYNRRTFGEQNPETAFALQNMAILLHRLGRVDEERPLLEQALAINLAKFGADAEQTLRSKASLAVFFFDTGAFEKSEDLLRGLIDSQGRVVGENNPATLESKANLAALLVVQERFDEAEVVLLDVLERRRKTMGVDNPETLNALREVVKLYADTERLDQARPLLEELIAARKRAAQDPEASPIALEAAAVILFECPVEELRDPELALEFARKANELTDGEQPQYLHSLARALYANGDQAGALATLKQALDLLPAEAPDRAVFEERRKEFEVVPERH